MPTPSYTAVCTSNTLIAKDIYEVRFTKPKDLAFAPGQFLLFDVPLIGHPEDIQTRAYSIASSPLEDELLFVFKIKEGGRASRWVMEELKVGDTVRMQGPFGVFTLNRDSDKDWILIATSTGVAPFRSQLVSLLQEEKRRIDLLYCVRSEEDLFWTDTFESMAKDHPNLQLHITLSKPGPAWKGHTGRVQTLLPNILSGRPNVIVYICGSPEMTKEVKTLCMEEYGLEKRDVHAEGYV